MDSRRNRRTAGPIRLEGDPKGASVVILGAGLAGMTAAIELERAGYRVSVLEFNPRPGGRNWTLRGGDVFTELGGATQTCEFDAGLYLNPGPWRIPYHHHAILDYCRRFGVALEPFIQLNHNAFLHSSTAFDGKPQRIRDVKADFDGGVSELLAKATRKGALDDEVSTEDREILLEALRSLGALDKDFRYQGGRRFGRPSRLRQGSRRRPRRRADRRRADRAARHSDVAPLAGPAEFPLLRLSDHHVPAGRRHGQDRRGVRAADPRSHSIWRESRRDPQNETGVTVTFEDLAAGGAVQEARADWCVCALPLTILSQLPINVSAPMKAAIDAVPYASAVKFGLQFSRRFWEEDEHIFGGISYTDLPIRQISYPSANFNAGGKGVLLGGYTLDGPNSYEFTAMSPAERLKRAVEFGAQIHPQYRAEFENGVSVAWHRVPFTLGCAGDWSDEARTAHYNDLCQIDGRIVLAGEHASYIPAWQEGAILSALDAIQRLHKRVVAS